MSVFYKVAALNFIFSVEIFWFINEYSKLYIEIVNLKMNLIVSKYSIKKKKAIKGKIKGSNDNLLKINNFNIKPKNMLKKYIWRNAMKQKKKNSVCVIRRIHSNDLIKFLFSKT